MKTAQVIRRFTFSEWGGTENVVWNTSQILNEKGAPTEILATNALCWTPMECYNTTVVRRFDYFYPYFPLSKEKKRVLDKKGGNPFVPQLESYLKSSDFNLIHCHNLGRLAELSARVATKKNIPLVLSLHGGLLDVPIQEREELARPLKHTLPYGGIIERIFRLRRDAFQTARGIVCVGENELEGLKAKFPDKKVCFLPNGVSPRKFAVPSDFDWRKELKLTPDTRLLLNISRIDFQKNQLLLIDLVKVLKERGQKVHLLMIGPPTQEWYYNELKSKIASENLAGEITILPGVSPEDERLRAAYLQADRFIIPSRHEPFGIVVLEAWSSGAPVIASNIGGLGRLVVDGRNGVKFESDNLDSLLAAYEKSPDRGSDICREAYREIVNKYDWKIVAKRLLDFYEEVSNG